MTEEKISCPKCNGTLVYTSDGFFRCVKCDYRRNAIQPVPSQAELLKENTELKKQIKKLTQKIKDLAQDTKWE